MVSMHSFLLLAALSGAGETVLLDFTAEWCPPCRMMEPTIRRLAAEGYPVRQVDISQQQQLAAQYNVTGVPCFVMLTNGQESDRVVGATDYARLVQMFQAARPQPAQANQPQVRAQSPDNQAEIAASAAARSQTGAPLQSVPQFAVTSPRAADAPWQSLQSPQPPARQTGANQTGDQIQPEQAAMQATVRLRIEDAGGHCVGTGTIVGVHGDEALVITCGHLFRDSAGRGRIAVEMFSAGASRSVPGDLLRYHAERNGRDIAVIAIRPGVAVTPAPVASSDYQVVPNDPVFTIGCDHGAAPSIVASHVTSVNRYVGPPNIEVRGQPVEGRSGGGLFSADGQLIGVCNAADPADGEGIYAGLSTVHFQLAEIGQRALYQRQQQTLAARSAPPSPQRGFSADATPNSLAPATLSSVPAASAQVDTRPTAATAAERGDMRQPETSAALTDAISPPMADGAEGIYVIRPGTGTQGGQVMFIDRPSPELVDRLIQESQRRQQAASLADQPTPTATATAPRAYDNGPVVRGQSQDNN